MRTKEDVIGSWNLYIDTYKHLSRNIGNWLNIEHPVPFEDFKKIFADTGVAEIHGEYAEWIRQTNNKLHVIVEKHGLSYYPSWTHYKIGLQELAYGGKLEDFIVKMGAWCLGDRLSRCITDGVSVDAVSLDDIIQCCYGDEEPDYLTMYNDIESARGRLSFRLKDNKLKLAIKECDNLLKDAIGDCAKHMESIYKEQYDEALRLLEYLRGDARYAEGVEFINNLLCDGQFNRWYYNGIHGQGDAITNITGYINILRHPERLAKL